MSLTDILPQSPLLCPCKGCTKRYFNEETKRTCHCDCKDYKEWADENRKRHEKRYKAHLVERGLREYELKRNNRIKKRARLDK